MSFFFPSLFLFCLFSVYSVYSVVALFGRQVMRYLAIGDIHGYADVLKRLLEAIPLRPDDQVIALGDYVDRGPDSCGVIEQPLKLRDRCQLVALRGNHDFMML